MHRLVVKTHHPVLRFGLTFALCGTWGRGLQFGYREKVTCQRCLKKLEKRNARLRAREMEVTR